MVTQPVRRHHQDSPAVDRPIIVGVGTDGRSTSAVLWATDEAERTGSPLRLVTAREHDLRLGETEPPLRNDLAGLARRLILSDIEHQVRTGSPVDVLLASAGDASVVVLGRRGMGSFHRRLIGGTSVAVATLSPVPVVVVPEAWIQPSLCSRPIVLGLAPRDITRAAPDGQDGQDLALHFAFTRASRQNVPLHVVSTWSIPPALEHNPHEIERCGRRFAADLEDRLQSWRAAFPTVEVETQSAAVATLPALLQAERTAQLTVVGTHSGPRLPSCGLGATTRHLMQQARRPVAVVPLPNPADPQRWWDTDPRRRETP